MIKNEFFSEFEMLVCEIKSDFKLFKNICFLLKNDKK